MYNRLNGRSRSEARSSDKTRQETSDLSPYATSDSYGSTPEQDKPTTQLYVPWCGVVFYVMAFFGFFSALLIRECLSVAIVAMVNQSAISEDTEVPTNVSEEQCPTDSERKFKDGEFLWNREQQGIVLAAFYYGYGLTPIPGGWLADRFGGKWLYGSCILLSSVICLLTPAAAEINISILIALRVLSGLGEGVMLPAIHALIARWSAPQYRSLVVGVIFVGTDVGIIVGSLVTGVLCDYVSWMSAFYVCGAVGCAWSATWFLLCYSSPSTHPYISTDERRYWETTIGATDLSAHPPTPWREILTSVPVWALAITLLANNWNYYTLVTCLPLYMHDVLGVDMTTNGEFSGLPFVTSVFMIPVGAIFVDWLRAPGRLSTTLVRKTFCAVGFLLPCCIYIPTGYIGCNRALAVAAMCAVLACNALSLTSVTVTQLDLAPLHAGKIMGLTFTVGNLGSVAAPQAVGALTYKHSTRSDWQHVFLLTAAVLVVGAAVFVIFGSAQRQSWADDNDHEEPLNILDQNSEQTRPLN